jgi:hypothetical protein
VFDRPTEDIEYLRKFRITMHASHSALSKSTSKKFARTQFSRRCQNVEISRNAKIISNAVYMYSSLPLPSAYPEALTLPPALLYQKDERVLPDGLQSHFFPPHSSSCRKYNVSH